MRNVSVAWLVSSILVAGCPSAELLLTLDVKTDFIAGEEFIAIRTELFTERPESGIEPQRDDEQAALSRDDFVAGVRVAEFGVSRRTYYVRVQLLSRSGDVVAERVASVLITTSHAVTLVIPRSCRGIVCPSGETCIAGGRCVDERCAMTGCEPECRVAGDCTTAAACTDARCDTGVCFYATFPGACPEDMWCNPEVGCVPRTMVPDAGPCEPSCDGRVCGDDGCGGSCGSCGMGMACMGGACVGCTAMCGGRACGDDGCGGSCGSCPAGTTCDGSGACVCAPSCAGRACGNDGCGGSCGSCPGGTTCDDPSGSCVCAPSCAGRECGPDSCGGGDCGTCPPRYSCDGAGRCVCSDLLAACGGGCCPGLACDIDGLCCRAVGGPCAGMVDCCTSVGGEPQRFCDPVRSVCCVRVGDGCSSDAQCCYDPGGGARNCQSGGCCVRIGGGCSSDGQCCTNNCMASTCR